jgi:hypothetical protein
MLARTEALTGVPCTTWRRSLVVALQRVEFMWSAPWHTTSGRCPSFNVELPKSVRRSDTCPHISRVKFVTELTLCRSHQNSAVRRRFSRRLSYHIRRYILRRPFSTRSLPTIIPADMSKSYADREAWRGRGPPSCDAVTKVLAGRLL